MSRAGAPVGAEQDGGQHAREQDSASSATDTGATLRRRYLEVTEFVLTQVRPKYQDAGVPCTDATVAAITATLFIATFRKEIV